MWTLRHPVLVLAMTLALGCGGDKKTAEPPPADPMTLSVPVQIKDWRMDKAFADAVAALPPNDRDAVTGFLDLQAQLAREGTPTTIPPGTSVAALPALAAAAQAAALAAAAVVATPAGDAVPLPEIPPGGSVRYGVVYDANGKAVGCENGTQDCLKALETPADNSELEGELCKNVAAIRKAETGYDQAFGGFIPTKQAPRKVEKLDGTATPWSEGTAFDTLGWSPDGPVRGSYWVEAKGESFTVHGVGKTADGKFVYCKADKNNEAAPATYTP